MSARQFNWFCPDCDAENSDEIDPEDGPFMTCTCSNCGAEFDQEFVPKIPTPRSLK